MTAELETDFDVESDPFDTSFAANILPGKAELKLIENEILNSANDIDFDPRAPSNKLDSILNNKVSIQLTNPGGQRESISSLDRISGKLFASALKLHIKLFIFFYRGRFECN